MNKLYSIVAIWLLHCSAYAQAANAGAGEEMVSPYVVYAFLIIFFGMIIGVGWVMWKGDKDPKAGGKTKR